MGTKSGRGAHLAELLSRIGSDGSKVEISTAGGGFAGVIAELHADAVELRERVAEDEERRHLIPIAAIAAVTIFPPKK